MGDFKDLKIDRSKIEEAITSSFNGTVKIKGKHAINQGHKYILDVEGAEALLNVFDNKNGTTSITHSLGKKPEISLTIAENIKAQCSFPVTTVSSFYIAKIAPSDLKVMFEFLEERGAKVDEEKKVNGGIQKRITGRQGDHLVFKCYNSESLQIQGKALSLFYDTIEILSELLPFKDVIAEQLKYYNANLTTADLIGEMQNRIPAAYSHLHDKIKSIIAPSIALMKVQSIELPDYSSFAFPALKGLEGILKQLLPDDLVFRAEEGFKPFFKGDFKTNKSFLLPEIKDKLTPSAASFVENGYNYYKTHRHLIFHANAVIEATPLLSRHDAEVITNKVLDMINDFYASVRN